MILWRLSGDAYARAFDGGYGLLHDGRWNTAGHPLTYCATSPSLCVLEKLVHVEDPDLLPVLAMVRYEVPEDLVVERLEARDLPKNWRRQEGWTQLRGDQWSQRMQSPLLRIPSVIVPLEDTPDMNVLINHRHPDSARIIVRSVERFVLDVRLF